MTPDQILAAFGLMVRRPVPRDCPVVDGSTPVVSFGNPTNVRVATLGINPSNNEFENKGRLMGEGKRRLATLPSIGAVSTESMSDDQILKVVDDCFRYFHKDRRPYRWFRTLDTTLKAGFGVSYYAESAVHLDLVQWATKYKWGDLPVHTRQILIDEGREHLQALLESSKIKYLVVNGGAVWKTIAEANMVSYEKVDEVRFGGNDTKCSLYRGSGFGATVLGWSSNLQSQPGANAKTFLETLGNWLDEQTKEI
jgi:hypothetical protein